MKCHCGRVTVTIPALPERLNECRCTLCYRYGALWGYFTRADVSITGETVGYVRDDADTEGSLAFHHCAHCGCLTHWQGVKNVDSRDRLCPTAKMGVNCRLLPEDAIKDAFRRVTYVRSGEHSLVCTPC